MSVRHFKGPEQGEVLPVILCRNAKLGDTDTRKANSKDKPVTCPACKRGLEARAKQHKHPTAAELAGQKAITRAEKIATDVDKFRESQVGVVAAQGEMSWYDVSLRLKAPAGTDMRLLEEQLMEAIDSFKKLEAPLWDDSACDSIREVK